FFGGPLIWAVHFGFIYAVASISVQATGETGSLARALIGVSGLIGVLAALAVLWAACRMKTEEPFDRFWRAVSAAGAVFAAIAVVWQTLPAFAPI
ncbi:MAG TPA: hypothetical protein VEF55_13985, partial [Candidatus Binatia bacterium]|nr:hypothetical protein [Candidatus Binatia bacterium]